MTMNTLPILVLLAVTACCFASQPGPCCLPEQWQANIENGDYLLAQMKVTTAFDQVRGLQGTKIVDRKTNSLYSHRFTDYNKNKTYEAASLPMLPNPTCYTVEAEMPLLRCLNDSQITHLQYEGSATLGPVSGGLAVETWNFRFSKYISTLSLVRNADDSTICSPVMQMVSTPNSGDGKVAMNVFTEFNSIQDEELLTMPEACQK